jgi:hypothetical protein
VCGVTKPLLHAMRYTVHTCKMSRHHAHTCNLEQAAGAQIDESVKIHHMFYSLFAQLQLCFIKVGEGEVLAPRLEHLQSNMQSNTVKDSQTRM